MNTKNTDFMRIKREKHGNPIGTLLEPYWNPIEDGGNPIEDGGNPIWNPIGTLLKMAGTLLNMVGTLLKMARTLLQMAGALRSCTSPFVIQKKGQNHIEPYKILSNPKKHY